MRRHAAPAPNALRQARLRYHHTRPAGLAELHLALEATRILHLPER